jgi:hypothetical protein
MAVSWTFSAHLDLHHNANLWLFWPTDFLLIGFGILLWRGADFSVSRAKFWRRYLMVRVSAVILAGLLWLAGAIEQNIASVWLYAGLPLAVIWTFTVFSRPWERLENKE